MAAAPPAPLTNISLTMRDAETGRLLWSSEAGWSSKFFSGEELDVHLPASLLKCNTVSREMTFSSPGEIPDLRMVQEVMLNDAKVEEWNFKFGFVIPGSTNSWQSCISGAGADAMLPREVLSGNLRIVTRFFRGSDGVQLALSRVRVFYDADR